MGRILAIDYGTKRSGVAVTDESRIIATALETVDTHRLLEFLKTYLAAEKVDVIVVGQPVRLHGEASAVEQQITGFVRNLAKGWPDLSVERYDERFTSKMAFQTMIDAGLKKEKRRDKAMIDRISATLILQSYMEYLENKALRS